MAVSTVIKKAESFYGMYDRKPGTEKHSTHYCPGCGHGNLHKLIAEALDDFKITDHTIFISPVGCSVFAYYYFHVGNIQSAHGRAPAVATGIKRAHPHSVVISYQGDGDLAAIGGNEILQAANRGENITVFFVNNAIYGMTGGQMAPTTLINMKTTTTPYGRSAENEGYPLRVCELLATLEAPVYLERVALTDAKHTNNVRKAVRKALQIQMENKGFSLVEVLSACPTGWNVQPNESVEWIEKNMIPYFPLGVFRDKSKEAIPRIYSIPELTKEEIRKQLDIAETEVKIFPQKSAPKPEFKNPEFIVSGFGGQGVLFLGYMLAEVGMRQNFHVSWLPSYGPEMRGGTANCNVRISEKEIGSPLVSRPNVVMAFNSPSMEKFESKLKAGGLLFYDSSLINDQPKRNDITIFPIPATKLADELGSTKVTNMIMLGAYLGYTHLLPLESFYQVLPKLVKREKLIETNITAIQRGAEYVQKEIAKS